MKRITIVLAIAAMLGMPAVVTYANAEAEATSGHRTEYLARQGIIVNPREVKVSEFISAIDYGYPEPEGRLGVYAYPGQYQVSTHAQSAYLSIGIQAARHEVAELPPLNVVFVVDTSGSMREANKIDWVIDSLEVFERSIRPQDTISLVSFNTDVRVLMPTTQMRNDTDKRQFLQAVRRLVAGGNTNLYGGLELGFAQLLQNLSSERVNRIVLLSDGLPTAGVQDPAAFRRLAESYRDVGVSISAIGLGTEADLVLIRDIGHWSSGTSRFIDDRDTMEETFGSGLGRLLVSVASDVVVDVRLAPGVSLVDTWGYDHQIIDDTVSYRIPALHDSDYETIVMSLQLPAAGRTGEQRIATVETSYRSATGAIENEPQVPVTVERVAMDFPVSGITNAMALRSVMMLRYGQMLVEVGQRYYDARSRGYDNRLSTDVAESLLGLVSEFTFDMENAELRLDEPVFADQLAVLHTYQNVLAEELQIAEAMRRARYDRYRRPAPVPERTIDQHINAVVTELRYSVRDLPAGSVAILGFTGIGDADPATADLIASRTYDSLARLAGFPVVSADTVSAVSRRRSTTPADLADAALAAEIGRELEVDYVVTGMLVFSPQTVHFFERLIRTSDGTVLTAAQVMAQR